MLILTSQPFTYSFAAVYITFDDLNFLRMRIGPNWYGLSAGQV